MIIYENNCLFIGLEEEQEKDSTDIPVWAMQDMGSNPPACQRPHSVQLDPLSFFLSPAPYKLLLYTWKIFIGNYFAKKYLFLNFITFYKLTFSSKKTSVENFPDSYTPVCEAQKFTLSNLIFWSHQEKYESNCVSRVSVTDIFCSLLNTDEFPLLGGKYSSVPVVNSVAHLFWQLYGTSCAAIHIARV